MKILHMADCHLDTPFRSLPPKAAALRRQALRDGFRRALERGAREGVDAVLIAGDLFDNRYSAPSTVQMLADFAAAHPEIHIFVSPGNHDYLFGDSPYAGLPVLENLTVFDAGEIQRVDLPGLGASVYGCGCRTAHSERSPLAGFRVEDGDRLNLLCVHGLVQGYGGHDSYNPISLSEIAQSGLDYIALGHVHSYSGVRREGRTYFAYPGCLVGRGFDETGEKGCLMGRLEKGAPPTLLFCRDESPTFEAVAADVTGAQSLTDVIDTAREQTQALPDESLVKLTLKGRVRPDLVINQALVAAGLSRFQFVKVADETRPELDAERLASEQTLTGLFVSAVLHSGADPAVVDGALRVGLAAIGGEELKFDED